MKDLKKIIHDEVYKLFYEREFQWLNCGRFDTHSYACNHAANMVVNRIQNALKKNEESKLDD